MAYDQNTITGHLPAAAAQTVEAFPHFLMPSVPAGGQEISLCGSRTVLAVRYDSSVVTKECGF